MKKTSKRIGDMLLEEGKINEFQLSSAVGRQRQFGGKLASILIKMGAVDEKTVACILEKQIGHKCSFLQELEIPKEALNVVKSDIAKKYCVIPLDFDQKTLTLAMTDPTDLKTVDELGFLLAVKIKPILAIEHCIKEALKRHYPDIVFEEENIYQVDTASLSEQIERTASEKPAAPQIHRVYSPELIIEALTEILTEKGIITKEEISKRIDRKLSRS